MERLSSFVLAHRRWIFAFWIVMFVAGIAAAGAVPNRLSYDFSLPGQQGYETEKKIIASYDGANAQAAYIPVVTVPEGQTVTGSAAEVQAVYDALRKIPTLRVVDYSQTKDKGFITERRPDDVRAHLRATAQRIRRPQPDRRSRTPSTPSSRSTGSPAGSPAIRSWRRAVATTAGRACSRRRCSARSEPWPCSRSSSPRCSRSSRCSSRRFRS